MSALLAIVRKELTLFRRDRVALLMTFIFPVVVGEFFGVVFGGGGGGKPASEMVIVVFDEDNTAASRAFAKLIDDSPDAMVQAAGSYDEARGLVNDKTAVAYVHIRKNFEREQTDLFTRGKGPTIELGVDPSKQAENGWVQGIITERAFRGMAASFTDPKMLTKQMESARASLRTAKDVSPVNRLLLEQLFSSVESLSGSVSKLQQGEQAGAAGGGAGGAGFEPIRIETVQVTGVKKRETPVNARALTFPQGMIWGIMGCAMGFAGTLAGERTRGTLLRLNASPVSPLAVLFGKGFATAIVTLCVCWLLLGVATLVHGIPVRDYPMLTLATLGVATAFMGIMMFAATVGSTEQATNRVGWFIMMGLAFIGGAAVPAMFFDGAMKAASNISPVKWSLEVIDAGLWRELTWEQFLPKIGVLLVIGAVTATLGVLILRRRSLV